MDKLLAKKLLVLVNTHNGLLVEYAENKIQLYHKFLESADTIEKVNKLQGKIAELKALMSLRDAVLQELKDD